MGYWLLVRGYRLGVRDLALFFAAAGIIFLALPAFAQIQIVPDACYAEGDYSIGYFLDLAQNILRFVLSISGAGALLMFVWGGFLMLSSAGEDKRVTQGREVLIQATTGLIIVLGSWTIVNYTVAALTTGTIGTSPAQIFGKNWSDLGSRECLSAHWANISKSVPPPPAAPAATAAAGTATVAAGSATTQALTTPSTPASAVDLEEEGRCCVHIRKIQGETGCQNDGTPDYTEFFEFNPSRPDVHETKYATKKRKDCLPETKDLGVIQKVGALCHLSSLDIRRWTHAIDMEKQEQKAQIFCGQQNCVLKPGNLLSCQ